MRSRSRTAVTNTVLPLVRLALTAMAASLGGCASSPPAATAPTHRVDATWPKPVPTNWTLGQVSGVAVDADSQGNLYAGKVDTGKRVQKFAKQP